eukprot:CAMPEP_0185190992 /NCGR_PEP_ID=MMETSP1140-20130426/13329_1 /TAXON_ID=298111 /ORGANISM="Pavlova sp., Strain CCMP459" /LENGTH=106 /DNA_ID=CAMNT_0027757671 /DNA_START=360 /DNA_END=678 /DNA_ORIENTATION=+
MPERRSPQGATSTEAQGRAAGNQIYAPKQAFMRTNQLVVANHRRARGCSTAGPRGPPMCDELDGLSGLSVSLPAPWASPLATRDYYSRLLESSDQDPDDYTVSPSS